MESQADKTQRRKRLVGLVSKRRLGVIKKAQFAASVHENRYKYDIRHITREGPKDAP